jgi:CubicO group peptidase (beta-lactamase class C family)
MHVPRSSSLLGLLAALAVATAAHPQTPAQAGIGYTDHANRRDGPVGKVADALIASINANDTEAFQAFLRAHGSASFRDAVPMEQHIEVYRAVWSDTRGLEYYGYRTYEPSRPGLENVIIVRDRLAGGWHGILIDLDEADKVAGLRFLPARPPSDLPPPPPLTRDGARRALDDYIDRLVAADAFSGTVLIARHGDVLFERAEGLASKRFAAANNLDTKFNLGSMNKMFTAVAIGQLVDDGLLSFDDPLSRYVDESWLPRSVTDRILIRHMLNHTSGLGSYFNEKFWNSSRAMYRALDDYKPLISTDSLAFDPGTGEQYSNNAFFLLGVVIEQVTGESYFDHVRRAIFEPAGMTSTDSYEMDRPEPNLAIGYVPEHDAEGRVIWQNNLYMHVIKGGPAGGGFSTVRDLLRFDIALRSGRILSAPTRDALWTARPDRHAPNYGYGFSVNTGPLGKVVGHGGGFPGLNGQLDIFVDAGYTIAVLSNYDGGAHRVAQEAAEIVGRIQN